MAETSRDLFASRLGMLAATLGSSVGLGNIWKFPALTGEHGGASFLLVYILSTLVVGLPLMIAELLIGRSTRSNAYQAFKTLSSNRFWWIIGGLGSAFWHPFFWLSAFVGAGLVFAGISGFCGLGVLLSHMPWNRR